MYQIVLAAALASTASAPNHCFHRSGCYGYGYGGCYSCYSGYSGYAGYAGYAPYAYCGGIRGPYTNPVFGYGCAGGCYGYHGGCYGGWGVFTGEPFGYGCTGCYGCYGGYAGYGVPVPLQPLNLKQQAPPNPYPAINPDAKKKVDEEVAPPKEKKKTASNDESRGKIRVTIPAGGKLFVDGNPIDVTPGTYVFRTPALAAGRSYFYDVRLEVTRDGGMVADERRVIIRPGEETTAVFANIPPPTATTASVNR